MSDPVSDDPEGDATIAELIAGGMTPAEVSRALGLSRERVQSVPFAIGSNHVSRVEAALVERAIGMTVTAERMNRAGDVVELRTELPPDVPAAKLVLEARDPERWVKREPERAAMAIDVAISFVRPERQVIEHAGAPPRGEGEIANAPPALLSGIGTSPYPPPKFLKT